MAEVEGLVEPGQSQSWWEALCWQALCTLLAVPARCRVCRVSAMQEYVLQTVFVGSVYRAYGQFCRRY